MKFEAINKNVSKKTKGTSISEHKNYHVYGNVRKRSFFNVQLKHLRQYECGVFVCELRVVSLIRKPCAKKQYSMQSSRFTICEFSSVAVACRSIILKSCWNLIKMFQPVFSVGVIFGRWHFGTDPLATGARGRRLGYLDKVALVDDGGECFFFSSRGGANTSRSECNLDWPGLIQWQRLLGSMVFDILEERRLRAGG